MKKILLLLPFTFYLFSPCNAQYRDLYDFSGSEAGAVPYGNLTVSGSLLYGMTSAGGVSGDGNLFSIDTNGNGYRDLFDFSGGVNGNLPPGDLLLVGNKFFGMTQIGGASDSGNVFSIDTDGSGYRDLYDLTGPNGAQPIGSLIISGKVLYGMTSVGGINHKGCVFSVDTDGTHYKDLLDFNGTNGAFPQGRNPDRWNAIWYDTKWRRK